MLVAVPSLYPNNFAALRPVAAGCSQNVLENAMPIESEPVKMSCVFICRLLFPPRLFQSMQFEPMIVVAMGFVHILRNNNTLCVIPRAIPDAVIAH